MNKKLLIAGFSLYTALVGWLGYDIGRGLERKAHKNDGITLSVPESSMPKIDLTARFGDRELVMKDLVRYARFLKPSEFRHHYDKATKSLNIEGAVRYDLIHADNRDIHPPQFTPHAGVCTNEETNVHIAPASDAEFRYGFY